jgi:hypothetical protein
MKTHRSILTLLALGLVASLPAAEKNAATTPAAQQDSAPELAGLFGGASLPVVWQSASAASEKIAAALAGRKLDGVAGWAETIHLAAHALEDQVTLDDPERARRLHAALRQAAKIADDVLDGANHNEFERAADAYRRLNSALMLAKLRLPKEIVDAPPQQVRFADAAEHAHDEEGGHVEKKK